MATNAATWDTYNEVLSKYGSWAYMGSEPTREDWRARYEWYNRLFGPYSFEPGSNGYRMWCWANRQLWRCRAMYDGADASLMADRHRYPERKVHHNLSGMRPGSGSDRSLRLAYERGCSRETLLTIKRYWYVKAGYKVELAEAALDKWLVEYKTHRHWGKRREQEEGREAWQQHIREWNRLRGNR